MKARGVVVVCAVLLLTGCTKTVVADDPAAAAASEAARARQSVPTTAPTKAPPQPVTAPPQPPMLAKNAIYGVGKLTANCPEPKVKPTSVANVRAYYTQSTACLNAAWAPAIRKAGFTFTPPKLDIVAGRSPDLPCDADAYGIYCGDTIYVDAQVDLDEYRKDPELVRGWMAFVIAHEYGHHVQALTGMEKAAFDRRLRLNGVDLALEESRRYELQASCFGGVYVGADLAAFRKDPGWADLFAKVVGSTDDDGYDHGSTKNHAYWSMAGFRAASPAACNTFTATAAQVS
ncbi:neutral zinc metallopeptidase [Kribbella yunnanensis]|uniref:neutral zinc metallopeptidase n=1 Tax=Kribbella yunnanensis TaxID=190194 RepID=UPI0031D9F4AF